MKIELSVVSPEQEAAEAANRCGEKPGPRSGARCEMPKGHERLAAVGLAGPEDVFVDHPTACFHAGRTASGRWKFWPTVQEAKTDEA